MIYGIALIAALATLCGGLFALRYRDKLHLILGFSAGAVIGVSLFDLLPEALELASGTYSIATTTSFIALGFVLFMVLDRTFSFHAHEDESCKNENHKGSLGVGSLAVHSFLDGLGIGLAFQASPAVGTVVALGVIAHDFSDGINMVGIVLRAGGEKARALKWVAVGALAPLVGIIASFFITVSDSILGLILAIFCGSFFYIGASDLLPESHHAHPTHWTTFATILGILTLYGAIHLAGI